MTKHTKRDMIWSAALKAGDEGAFTVNEILFCAGLTQSSERTARDVLNTMEELDHLRSFVFPNKNGKVLWASEDVEIHHTQALGRMFSTPQRLSDFGSPYAD